jgi:hypothetical protein
MSDDDLDRRFAALLHEDAPPERDPLFRVEVLQRIERATYRRRLVAAVAGAAVFAVIAVLGATVGGAPRSAAIPLLIGAALTCGYFVLAPVLTQMLARFR